MKIAIVNKHFRLGGIETVVHQLRDGLQSRGHTCDLWFSEHELRSHRNCYRLFPRMLDRLHRSRFAWTASRLFPRKAWTERQFRRLLTRDYDLFHIHGFDETYASLEALRNLARERPTAVTLHGSWFFSGGCGQPVDCQRYMTGCGDCPQLGVWPISMVDNTAAQLRRKSAILGDIPAIFISPARHLREKALRSVPGRGWTIEHIPNGVDCSFYSPERKTSAGLRSQFGVSADKVVVLALCRDFQDPVKGFRIMQQALSSGLDAHVFLVGLHADLAARTMPCGLQVTALDFVSDRRCCADLFELADVFLFSSIAETFPCVILEAMSAGCCVVSTPSDGVAEQIKHEQTGLIARSCTGEALSVELSRACSNASLRGKLGAAARAQVQREFSETVMVERHEALYSSMIL